MLCKYVYYIVRVHEAQQDEMSTFAAKTKLIACKAALNEHKIFPSKNFKGPSCSGRRDLKI